MTTQPTINSMKWTNKLWQLLRSERERERETDNKENIKKVSDDH